MAPNVGIRLMASMWDDLVHMVFAGLLKPVVGQMKPTSVVDIRPDGEEARDWIAERLLRRYIMFENLPSDPVAHRGHVLLIYKLAEAALELRDISTSLNKQSTGDPLFTYEIYAPLLPNSSDVRFALLENQNRHVAHLESDDLLDKDPHGHLLARTLCGGLIRQPRKIIRDESGQRFLQLRTRPVLERKGAVVTASPPETELTKLRY